MKLYIIPAYGDTARKKSYKKIITEAERKGYEVKVLNLQIKGKLLSDLTNKAIKTIDKETNCAIFGFSMGALIAYNISTIVPVRKVILASVSPALGADIKKKEKEMVKYYGRKTIKELIKLRYKKPKAKNVVFLYGSEEREILTGRTKKLYKMTLGSKELVVIKGNDHDLNDDYIKEIIKRL